MLNGRWVPLQTQRAPRRVAQASSCAPLPTSTQNRKRNQKDESLCFSRGKWSSCCCSRYQLTKPLSVIAFFTPLMSRIAIDITWLRRLIVLHCSCCIRNSGWMMMSVLNEKQFAPSALRAFVLRPWWSTTSFLIRCWIFKWLGQVSLWGWPAIGLVTCDSLRFFVYLPVVELRLIGVLYSSIPNHWPAASSLSCCFILNIQIPEYLLPLACLQSSTG